MAIEKLTGIVTNVVRHSDRMNIVTLYTRERGSVSFLSPVGTGRGARQRSARLMPLAVVSTEVNFKGNKDLQTLGSLSSPHPWQDLYFNPVKSTMVIFLAEFLHAFLRHSESDPAQWDYVFASIGILDKARKDIGNIHLAFLIGFLHFAGIFPDLSEMKEDMLFDMRAGQPTYFAPGHSDFLSVKETAMLPGLLRMNMRNRGCFRFSGAQRRLLLQRLLRYYGIHFPGMGDLKSPEVLSEIFS